MTANVKIETSKRENVSVLPLRAVITVGGKSVVKIKTKDEPVQKEIVIGQKDSVGNVEVISGLSSSDQVLLNP